MESLISSDGSHLLRLSDLGPDGVRSILATATSWADGDAWSELRTPPLVGLLFLTSSLRTRVGFAAAAARLDGSSIDVAEARWDPDMSAGESFEDTLRTVSGMVDVVVVRTDAELEPQAVDQHSVVPVINGGDGGGHHPTQALIDLFAIERIAGPIENLTVGLVGDLTMRACKSLIRLMNLFPPARLVLEAPDGRRQHGVELVPELARRTTWDVRREAPSLDVLVMIGLPPRTGFQYLNEAERREYALTSELMERLKADVVVLSPLPVIDEIHDNVRPDRRIRIFEGNDLATFVRAATLLHVLGHG